MRRHFLFSIIYIIACFSSVKAQSLSDLTISAYSLNTEEITATMGETNISSSFNSHILSPGFIEVLLAEAVEIPDNPIEEEPENPTSVDQLENSITIKTTRNLLQIYCSQPHLLTIFNIKGVMILKEKIELDYNKHLSTGIYILILHNEKDEKVYKINIH
ncbi:MAG: hypothetical protein IKU29_07760 [Parabacteroides sp.]|nr:hypothetical protein [Parabacteroides sp.]